MLLIAWLRRYGWELALFGAAALLLFGSLGCPLQEPEEARYAEIPRQMLAEGSWVAPVLHGQPYYDKPPLLYWLVMGSYQVFGVHDWAARLVAATAGFLTIVVTYGWGLLVSRRAALAGAFILCLSARFVYLSHLLTMNGLLCLWVVAALAAGHAALMRSEWRWWILAAVACGMGILTKGPVALVLVLGPILICLALAWSGRDLAGVRGAAHSFVVAARRGAVFVAVAVAVAAPWFVAVARLDPTFLEYFFWKHHVERFVAPFDHTKPWWFYLPEVLLGMMPWTLLLPGCLMASRERKRPEDSDARDVSSGCLRGACGTRLAFFFAAAGVAFLFFSLSGCKRPGYILPVLPPLALALGAHLDSCFEWEEVTALLRSPSRLAGVATVAVLLFAFGGVIASQQAELLSATGMIMPVSVICAGCVAALWLRRRLTWAVCAGVTLAGLMVANLYFLPAYAARFALREEVCNEANARTAHVICFPHRWDSVSFYLQRDDVLAFSQKEREQFVADLLARPASLVFVKTDRALPELLTALPDSLELVIQQPGRTVTTAWVRRRAPK
jgi:dolichol-phosphate mannosyltransferase